MRITLDEWPAKLTELANQIHLRWPWLHTSYYHHTLSLETTTPSHISGSVDLKSASGSKMFLKPEVNLSSGPALAGDLSDAEAALQCYRTVLDALHFASAFLGNLEVHFELPCSTCGGSGKVSEKNIVRGRSKVVGEPRDCPTCGGSGKAPTP